MRFTAPLTVFFICLTACGKAPAPASGGFSATPVGVAAPIARDVPTVRTYTGRLEAIQSVDVRARIGGTVLRVPVQDGAAVTAGDVLFEIDAAPQQAAVARAEAECARADAALAQAGPQAERARKLFSDHAVSQQVVDDAVAALAVAKANVAAAQAARDSARIDLGYTRVTAPITGRIGKILATPGNVVQASSVALGTLLTTLVATDPLYAVCDIDEDTWHAIGPAMRASASGGTAMPVRVSVPGAHSSEHTGYISFTDNHIDATSGTIRVRATISNPDGTLTPGAFARIQVTTAPPRHVLLIDERTILSQLNTRYVYVADAQGLAAMRPLTLGGSVGTLRIVEHGLAPDDRVIVNNLTKIFFAGMPVMPLPASMETLQNLPSPAAEQVAPSAASHQP